MGITITKRSDLTRRLTDDEVDANFQELADLSDTATDDGTKGFHLVHYPPLSGETGVVNYEYPWNDARRFGVTADGVTDDTTALTNFFTAISGNLNGLLPAGSIKIASEISHAFTNCKISGIPNNTTITGSFGYSLIELLASSNVVFEDIIFDTTYVNASDDAGAGIVHAQKVVLSDITFNRCTFTGSACGCNGIGLYPRTLTGDTAGSVNGFTVTNCNFENIGRIACTLLNRGTASDKYDAFRGLNFSSNIGKNLGLTSAFGFMITLDGYGSQFHVDNNRIENALEIGIENTGWIDGTINGNTFDVFTRTWSPIQTSGNTMTGLQISGNSVESPGSQASLIYDVDNSYFSGNSLESTGDEAVIYRDCNKNTIVGDWYKTDSTIACHVESASANCKENRFIGCNFDTSGASSNNSCLRFNGANCQSNIVTEPIFDKGTGGVFLDEVGSASLNLMFNGLRSGVTTMYFDNTAVNFTSDADLTTVLAQYSANNLTFTDTGAVLTTGRNIVLPDFNKQYSIKNSTLQTLTIKTSAGGTVAIATTNTAIVAATATGVSRVTADV